jgi:hypothetical protein
LPEEYVDLIGEFYKSKIRENQDMLESLSKAPEELQRDILRQIDDEAKRQLSSP